VCSSFALFVKSGRYANCPTETFDMHLTQCAAARVPRVGECADKRLVWPLLCEKNRMRQQAFVRARAGGRPAMVVPAAIANGMPQA
jgi:hypothetical protein